MLEERVVLSTSKFLPTQIWDNVASALGISKKTKPAAAVGTLGDSYTDEYRFYTPDQSHARNWVEIAGSLRKSSLTFGKFSTRSRGEPRDQGYALNWARDNATSTDMVQNQLPGLTAQVKSGQVKYVSIFIGGDDYLALLKAVATGATQPDQAKNALPALEKKLAANLQTAVGTLLAANSHVKIVVFTLPSISELPIVQEAVQQFPQYQGLVDATDRSIQAYNTTIMATASNNSRVAVVDLATQAAQLTSSPTGTISFGGTSINVKTPGNSYRNFFLADGIHLGTIGQGIIASDFISAINVHFHANVRGLTAQQIVSFAKHVRPNTP